VIINDSLRSVYVYGIIPRAKAGSRVFAAVEMASPVENRYYTSANITIVDESSAGLRGMYQPFGAMVRAAVTASMIMYVADLFIDPSRLSCLHGLYLV
jgi:hypothetical protein